MPLNTIQREVEEVKYKEDEMILILKGCSREYSLFFLYKGIPENLSNFSLCNQIVEIKHLDGKIFEISVDKMMLIKANEKRIDYFYTIVVIFGFLISYIILFKTTKEKG